MRKVLTVIADMSEKDWTALTSMVATKTTSFHLDDVKEEAQATPQEQKKRHHSPHQIRFGRDDIMQMNPNKKDRSLLTKAQVKVLDILIERFGGKPFRKGDASNYATSRHGNGASPCITALCRQGFIVAAQQTELPLKVIG